MSEKLLYSSLCTSLKVRTRRAPNQLNINHFVPSLFQWCPASSCEIVNKLREAALLYLRNLDGGRTVQNDWYGHTLKQ